LKVKPGQVGSSNATKPENLGKLAHQEDTLSSEDDANAQLSGVLDYAHLRVPLPSDLSSSGIFTRGPNRKFPEAYFLMVSGRTYAQLGNMDVRLMEATEAFKRWLH